MAQPFNSNSFTTPQQSLQNSDSSMGDSGDGRMSEFHPTGFTHALGFRDATPHPMMLPAIAEHQGNQTEAVVPPALQNVPPWRQGVPGATPLPLQIAHPYPPSHPVGPPATTTDLQPWAVASSMDVPPPAGVIHQPTKGKQRQLNDAEMSPPERSFAVMSNLVANDEQSDGSDENDPSDEEMATEDQASFSMKDLERELSAFARNDPTNPAAQVFRYMQRVARDAKNGGNQTGSASPAHPPAAPPPAPATSPAVLPVLPPPTPRHGRVETVHRPADKLRLERQVRIYSRVIMNRPNLDSPFLPPPTEAEQEAFEKHRGPGPTLTAFNVNVSGTNARGAWNRRCAYLFAHEFVKICDAVTRDVEVAKNGFLSHIPALCKQYKALSSGGDDEEEIVLDGMRVQNTRTNRKRGLAKRRLGVTELKSSLGKNREWIFRLGADGHSEDETDRERTTDGRPRYIIMKLPWRSDDATRYVRALDVVHLSTRWTRAGRPKKGTFPRIRVAVKNKVDRGAEAVPGLPRNFYNPDWLAGQSPEDRQILQIQDYDADLSIPRDIQTILHRYSHAKGPGAPPLPA